jgi:MFS family permease
MVGQVLTTAVQNAVERRHLGVAMSTTSFFRGLGGAVGAAVLGAVFAARAGGSTGAGAISAADVAEGVQAVFLVAAPLAALALLVALLLRETPLADAPPTTPNR